MKPIMTFFENVLYKISKKYFTFKNRLIKYDCQQSKVYYIKMAGKNSKFQFGEMYVQTIFRNIVTNLVNMKVFFT